MPERIPPPPPDGFVRVRMRVAFDGAPFRGFARSHGVPTVQGALEDTLSQVLRHPVRIACAGRTDAGVHARGQVVSFDADTSHFDPHALDRALNRILRPTIAVDRIEAVPPDFDARLSCLGRTYRYHVLDRQSADPLTRHMIWHVRNDLDIEPMNVACKEIIGLHDFTTFSKRNKSRPTETFLRRVHEAGWTRTGDVLRFEISANAYAHQMVRSLVAMFVDIGRGRRSVDDVGVAFSAMRRDAAPSPAPPNGLIFWRADYTSNT